MTLEQAPPGTHRPSFLSAKGAYSVALGDVVLSHEYHRAAALAAEMAAVHPAKGRHALRFQVATQHFKAGDYAKAKRVAAGVTPGLLPGSLRRVFDRFRQNCLSRTRPGSGRRFSRVTRTAPGSSR